MEFKDRLKATRKQKHLSQDKLAELLGVTKQAISHWERGTREPDHETLLAIADILNVSTDYLLGHADMTAQIISQSELELLELFRTTDSRQRLLDYASKLYELERMERETDDH